MRWILGVLIATALVVGGSPPAVADPAWPTTIGWRGCPAPDYRPSDIPALPPAWGERVLIIGDSLTRDSRTVTDRILRDQGWNPTFRCWGGKRVAWGIDQVERARTLGHLPQTVVIALGTNDMWSPRKAQTRRDIASLLDVVGPERTVVWVNLHFDGGIAPSRARERWFNDQLLREAANRPNLMVLDWADIARRDGVRSRDGVHYPRAGSRARARAIADALALTIPSGAATREMLASGA